MPTRARTASPSRPRSGADVRAELKSELVEAAGRLLHAEGPAALSVRRLADSVGVSTQAIYTLFGGKDGVVSAMYREGFARLEVAMRGVEPGADPVEDLRSLGRAYRASALENPNFYDVMFGRAVPGFECDDADRAEGLRSFQLLLAGVERAVAAGAVMGDAHVIAAHLWVCVHGHVSLELAGFLRGPHLVDYDATLNGAIAPFLPG